MIADKDGVNRVMEYIEYALRGLGILFMFILITKIYMAVANYVGEQLCIGKFVLYLLKKIRKK